MRISALYGVSHAYYGNNKVVPLAKKQVAPVCDLSFKRPQNVPILLSFGARTDKNVAQVASIAPEYQGILNSIYKKGGLGNVAGEAAVAFSDEGKLDVRTFVPYYSGENDTGGVRVMVAEPSVREEIAKGAKLEDLGERVGFKSVNPEYQLKENETFIIQQRLNKSAPLNKQIAEIEPTSLKGAVKTINEDMTSQTSSPYHIFKVKGTEVGQKGNPPVYIVHTPEIAKFGAAYNSEGAYCGKLHTDALYTRFTRATADAIPKMNTEEFKNYNPGNYWLHDRQAFPFMMEVDELSSRGNEYWRGIRTHATYHNLGPDYQGHYCSPIDFMQIVGSENDLNELKKNPADYKFVQKMAQKMTKERNNGSGKFSPEEILTKEELNRLNQIFKPIFGDFLDENGQYNMCEIPIAGVKHNPYNTTAGTVSKHYAREMKNPNTKEVSLGITRDLASIPTTDIVNGSSAVSLGLDKVGKIGCGTGFDMKGFTPFDSTVVQNKDAFFNLKQSNKEWFINSLSSVLAKPENEAKEILFSQNDIRNGASVLGNISPYKEGDMLFISWGRSDSQKGFPTTIEGFLQYLKDESVPQEQKLHTKFVIGADPWKISEEARAKGIMESTEPDWLMIKDRMKQIQELDDGIYKDNICYLNGRFSNRTVACADFTNITSRFEPCGITPLESFAGGTPVISNNTGGSPNFINALAVDSKEVTNQNGFLTHHAFLSNPETLGLDKNLTGAALDKERVRILGSENAECIKKAADLYTNDKEGYKRMMMNAKNAEIEWHNNAKYNNGMSALDCYRKNVWGLTSANKEAEGFERSCDALENLKGSVSKNSTFNPKTLAKTLGIAAAIAGIGTIAFVIGRKILKNKKSKLTNPTINKTAINPSNSTIKKMNMENFQKQLTKA